MGNNLVRSVLRKTGLEPLVGRAYLNARYQFEDDMKELSVGEHTAHFKFSSPVELARFDAASSGIEVAKDLLYEVEDDDIFWDVGANIGVYTALIATAVPNGQVVAIEPVPRNIDSIRANLQVTSHDANSLVLQYALSDETGVTQLSIRRASWWGGMTDGTAGAFGNILESFDDDTMSADTVTVDTLSGDELVERGEAPFPTVMKIDVDGAEMLVLNGLENTLSSEECRLLYIEVHPKFLSENGYSVESVHQRLEEYGFEIERIHFEGGDTATTSASTYHLKCQR